MVKKLTCPVKLHHPQAQVPTRGSERAICYDFYCVGGLEGLDEKLLAKFSEQKPDQVAGWRKMETDGQIIVPPSTGFLFRTGISMAIEEGHGCFFWDRSGMGGSRLIHRFAGVIDEDYRGEWFVRLFNFNATAQVISVGDRIVQGVFQERIEAEFPVVGTLPESVRGTGGFGSTGD
jgi:dUTP pyrophosphatase